MGCYKGGEIMSEIIEINKSIKKVDFKIEMEHYTVAQLKWSLPKEYIKTIIAKKIAEYIMDNVQILPMVYDAKVDSLREKTLYSLSFYMISEDKLKELKSKGAI